MRAFDIMLLILTFNITLSIIGQTGLFGDSVNLNTDTTLNRQYNVSTTNLSSSYKDPTQIQDFATIAWSSITGVLNLFIMLGNTVGILPFYLINLGVPDFVAWSISFLVGIMYAVGIAQLWSGKSTRDIE